MKRKLLLFTLSLLMILSNFTYAFANDNTHVHENCTHEHEEEISHKSNEETASATATITTEENITENTVANENSVGASTDKKVNYDFMQNTASRYVVNGKIIYPKEPLQKTRSMSDVCPYNCSHTCTGPDFYTSSVHIDPYGHEDRMGCTYRCSHGYCSSYTLMGYYLDYDPCCDCGNHSSIGITYNEDSHPHKEYTECAVCWEHLYTGNTGYNSACTTCNPPACQHNSLGPSVVSSDHSTGHEITKECNSCGEDIYEGEQGCYYGCSQCTASNHSYSSWSGGTHSDNHVRTRTCSVCGDPDSETMSNSDCCACGNHSYSTSMEFDTGHPHQGYYECTRSGCNAKNYISGMYGSFTNCETCHPPVTNPLEHEYYYINRSGTTQRVNVSGSSNEEGRAVTPFVEDNSLGQKFRIVNYSGDLYYIYSLCSNYGYGKGLGVNSSNNVILTSSASLWKFTPSGSGYKITLANDSTKYLYEGSSTIKVGSTQHVWILSEISVASQTFEVRNSNNVLISNSTVEIIAGDHAKRHHIPTNNGTVTIKLLTDRLHAVNAYATGSAASTYARASLGNSDSAKFYASSTTKTITLPTIDNNIKAYFQDPLPNAEKTSPFGWRCYTIREYDEENDRYITSFVFGHHNGTDYGVGSGTNIVASASGTVDTVVNSDSGARGKYTIIKVEIGDVEYYYYNQHMSTNSVTLGSSVNKGVTIVGKSGNTGTGTGAHFHLEYRKDSSTGLRLSHENFF